MKTEVIFSFDTEDFTNERNADAVVTLANILTEEGVTGHFGVVGLLAQQFTAWGRKDAVEALKKHIIGFHSYSHTIHPTLVEMSDVDDIAEAASRVEAHEAKGLELIRKTFGNEPVLFAVPPGADVSYPAEYYYCRQGIQSYWGGFVQDDENSLIDYCGLTQITYTEAMENIFFGKKNLDELLEKWSHLRRIILFHHPNMSFKSAFWDGVNYNRRNSCEFGKWAEAPDRSPEDTKAFFEWFRATVRRVKQDPRFEVTDIKQVLKRRDQHAAGAITPENLSALTGELDQNWGPLKSAPYCVSDVFYAAASFLQGKKSYMPLREVKGFLYKPEGIKSAVTVSAESVRKKAQKIVIGDYIPPQFTVDGQDLGPADMLFAMAVAVEGKEAQIRLTPRPQTVDISELKQLSKLNLKGGWLFSDDFEDRYITNRLRLQAWTWRKYGI